MVILGDPDGPRPISSGATPRLGECAPYLGPCHAKFDLGRHEEAIDDLEQITRLDPGIAAQSEDELAADLARIELIIDNHRTVLPDFPKLKKRLLRLAQFCYNHQIEADELIGSIRALPYFEGNRFVTGDVEGYMEESTEEEMEISCEINRSAIIEQGIDALLESYKKAAQIHVQAMHEMLFRKHSEATARVGNQIDAAGEPFSMDLYFKLLETVQIDFDSHGRPDISGTRLIMHPSQAERVQSLVTQWQTDESFQRRYSETMLRKREEWRDRESNRKLVG